MNVETTLATVDTQEQTFQAQLSANVRENLSRIFAAECVWWGTATADQQGVALDWGMERSRHGCTDAQLLEWMNDDKDASAFLASVQAEETEAKEVQDAQQRKEADKALEACIRANNRAEKSLLEGKLEAGKHAWEYLTIRLSLLDSREAIIQTIEGELARYSRVKINANDLVGAFQAYSLLAVSQGLDKAPGKGKAAPAMLAPWTHYKDCWSKLVKRTTSKAGEVWAILPGIEEAAKEVFKASLDNARSLDAVSDICKDLVSKSSQHVADQVRDERKAKEAKLERERLDALEKQRKAQELKGNGAPEEDVTKAAIDAAKALKQTETSEADLEKARKQEEAADQKALKDAQKAAGKPGKQTPAPKLETPPAGTPPAGEQKDLPTNKPAPIVEPAPADDGVDAIELGRICAEEIANCDAPDDALESFLETLASAKGMSKIGLRAVQAALTILKRPVATK